MQRMLGGGRETLFRYWMWYAVYGTMCSDEVGQGTLLSADRMQSGTQLN